MFENFQQRLYVLVAQMLALGFEYDHDEISFEAMESRMQEFEEADPDLYHIAVGFSMLVGTLSDLTWAVKAMNQIAADGARSGDFATALRDGALAKRAIEVTQTQAETVLSSFIAGVLGNATEGGANRETLIGASRQLFPNELVEQLVPQIDLAISVRDRGR